MDSTTNAQNALSIGCAVVHLPSLGNYFFLVGHAHRESGQLAQPIPDSVYSKRAAFFNSFKSKVGHIVAKASAMRVNLNLSPTVPSPPRPRPNTSHAPLLYALNLSHHVLPPPGA